MNMFQNYPRAACPPLANSGVAVEIRFGERERNVIMAKKTQEIIDYSWASDYLRREVTARARLACKLARAVADYLESDDVLGFYAYLMMLDSTVRAMVDGADKGIESATPRNKGEQMTRLLLKAFEK